MSTRVTPSATVLIGRRPVHDRDLRVVAWELRTDAAAGADPGTDLVLAGLVDIGLERLAGGCDVVVALPDAMIRNGTLAHLPLARLILDLGSHQVPDDEIESVVRSVRGQGLRIRVADPVAHPGLAGLADVADVVTVDAASLTSSQRRHRLRQLARPGRLVLAAGVDDHDMHDDCRAAGYDLFEGLVLSTPNVVSGTRLAADRAALLHAVAVMADPDAGVDQVEAAVASNPSLSYQVLRYVNSVSVGLRTEVDSIRHAVVLVGLATLGHLTQLLLVRSSVGKPPEASRIALSRARMCAALGTALGDPRPAYHTVGLLSAVDLLTDVALEEALTGLPLTAEVVDALLHHDGRLGRVLQAVRLYERCDWDDPVLASFDPALLSEAYFSSQAWADRALRKDRALGR